MVTYTKIGEAWGIRGAGAPPSVGEQVTVSKRDGSVNVETVEAVVATGLKAWPDRNDGWAATIVPRKKGDAPADKKAQALAGIMRMIGGMGEDAVLAIHNQIAKATGNPEIN